MMSKEEVPRCFSVEMCNHISRYFGPNIMEDSLRTEIIVQLSFDIMYCSAVAAAALKVIAVKWV